MPAAAAAARQTRLQKPAMHTLYRRIITVPLYSFIRNPVFAAHRLPVLAAMLLMALADNAFAHGVTLKLQSTQPSESALTRHFISPWAQQIHDASGGRINLLGVQAEQTAPAADLFQLAQDRAADVVWLDHANAPEKFPRFSIFGSALPGSSSAGSSQALWYWCEVNDLAFREFKELRILAASRHDAPLFHMREKSIASLSDLSGLKIAVPNGDGREFLAALGASPLVMPASEMGKALGDASVDGVLLSWSSLETYGLGSLVKTHVAAPSGAPWAYAEISALLMNPDAYRGLADDLKTIVRANSGIDVSAWIGKVLDETAARARQGAAERGDTIGNLSGSDLAGWNLAAEAAIAKRVKALDEQGLRGEKMVGKVRALITEYDTAR
jgi:TRAP-type C4-dicarboxylate transport system substrate-binding protein